MNMETIKAALEAKLTELQARAEEIEDDLAEAPDSDWDENAIESEDDEVLARVGNMTLQDMREIKLAIARIDAGDYGVCVSCKKKIRNERLKALPFAKECVECASA